MDNRNYDKALFEYLGQFVTDNKKTKFNEVLDRRTRNLTVVLEDIFKPHNASAVLRTAECLGLQDVHVVEQDNAFDYNPYVLRGSGKWLTLHQHNDESKQNVKSCFDSLKREGYTILATSPHAYAVDYKTVELPEKIAVVFGAEETGITPYVQEHADHLIKIPMKGFTESFNISVSAAIILEYYNENIRLKYDIGLTEDEKFELHLDWFKKVVPNLETHISYFNKMNNTSKHIE